MSTYLISVILKGKMKTNEVVDYWKSNFSFKSAKEISFDLLTDKSTRKGVTRKSLVPLITGNIIRYC